MLESPVACEETMEQNDIGSKPVDVSSQLNDVQELPLATQVLPRRASAKIASDAIRKSYHDEKLPVQTLVQHKSSKSISLSALKSVKSPTRSSNKVSAKTKIQLNKLKKCAVKLQHFEKDSKFKHALVAKYGKDVHEKITDQTLSVKVAVSLPKRCLNGGGKGSTESSAVKQIKLHGNIKVPAGYKVVSTGKNIHSALANGNVKFVVVGPKPGSQIVNPGKPQSKELLPVGMNSVGSANPSNQQKDVQYRTVSTSQVVYKCELCSVGCANIGNLVNHKRLAHKDQCFICYKCGKGFATAIGLKDHQGQPCQAIKPVPAEATNTHTSRSVIAVFPNKSQLLISKSQLTTSQSDVKYSPYAVRGSQHNASGTVIQKSAASETVKTQAYVLAEPGGKYTHLNTVKFHGMGGTASTEGAQPGIYAGTKPINFVCESCLAAFPSNAALDSHTCSAFVPVAPAESVPMEVEQLARFYSSIVFKEF